MMAATWAHEYQENTSWLCLQRAHFQGYQQELSKGEGNKTSGMAGSQEGGLERQGGGFPAMRPRTC